MIRTGRKIAILALPFLTVLSGILLNFYNYFWIDWIFKICLSGTVGIGTNYIAIKMLFRPLERTPLGRQGLIPKRRGDIAEAIATAVSKQLLDTDSVLAYLEENDLIQKGASEVLEWGHNWIEEPLNHQTVINSAGRYVQNKGIEHAGQLFSKIAEIIRIYASESITPEVVWDHIRESIESEIEKPETIHLLTVIATDLVEKNSSTIAGVVNEMLEDWINSKGFLVKQAMLLGKGVFRIDRSRIRKELLKKVRSPQFFQNVMGLLEENISSISSLGDDPELKNKFSEFFHTQKQRFDTWVKTEGVTSAREKLISFLESDSFWNWLERMLDRTVGKLVKVLEKKIQSPEFKENTRNFVVRHAHRIDIKELVRKKVNEFELEQLEELITEVSGESLAGIELFGGLLGMLAGLILIDQWFAAVLVFASGLFWLIEKLFSNRKTAS